MKQSDSVIFTTVGVGIALGVGVWMFWPSAPWYVYAAVALSTLMAIPGALKGAAEQKAAKKILDE